MVNKFRLDNNQRKYFGLNAVVDNWDVVNVNGVAEIYFYKDVVKKIIFWDQNRKHVGYQEYDYDIKTNSRQVIVSKTDKLNKNLSL